MKNTKLRYYLRGLGIGILVTACILGLTDNGDVSMSDAQIKQRAQELGMIDAGSVVLSDLRKNETDETASELQPDEKESNTFESQTPKEEVNSSEEQLSEEETDSSEEQLSEEETNAPEEQSSEEETNAPEEQLSEEETNPSEEQITQENNDAFEQSAEESQEATEKVTIKIVAGTGSLSVCKDLEAAGLIEDALKFDYYLCNNGYSRIIHTGTYKIAVGTDEEEIAKIITGKR